VTTCSKRCKTEKKRANRQLRKHGKDSSEMKDIAFKRESRKEQKKRVKAERRAQRKGDVDPSFGQKKCDTCDELKDLLIRCQIDESQKWHMVCGKCWNKHSGGVPDGDADHPHYRYGGLWKNLHK